jgi:hypothetical protein
MKCDSQAVAAERKPRRRRDEGATPWDAPGRTGERGLGQKTGRPVRSEQ